MLLYTAAARIFVWKLSFSAPSILLPLHRLSFGTLLLFFRSPPRAPSSFSVQITVPIFGPLRGCMYAARSHTDRNPSHARSPVAEEVCEFANCTTRRYCRIILFREASHRRQLFYTLSYFLLFVLLHDPSNFYNVQQHPNIFSRHTFQRQSFARPDWPRRSSEKMKDRT